MAVNLTNAEPQKSDIIPDGTIAPVCLTIRSGGHGDGGWYALTKSGLLHFDCELTITEGPHARRKFWQMMMMEGGPDSSINASTGRPVSVEITESTLRAIIESSQGIKDLRADPRGAEWLNCDEARLNGLVFLCKISVEKDRTGQYPDKNRIGSVITPTSPKYGTGPVNWDGFGKFDAPKAKPGGPAGQTGTYQPPQGGAPASGGYTPPPTGGGPAPGGYVPPTQAPPQGGYTPPQGQAPATGQQTPPPPPPQGQAAPATTPPANPVQANAPAWSQTPPPNQAPQG